MNSIEVAQAARFQRRGVTQNRVVHGDQGDALQDLFRPAQRRPRTAVRATQRSEYFDANETARDAILMVGQEPAEGLPTRARGRRA